MKTKLTLLSLLAPVALLFISLPSSAAKLNCASIFSPDRELNQRSFLVDLLSELRSVSFITQIAPMQRMSGVAPEGDLRPLSAQELDYIRKREKKFYLSDDELTAYWANKVNVRAFEVREQIIESVAERNAVELAQDAVPPTAAELFAIKAAIRALNSDFLKLSYMNVETMRDSLQVPMKTLNREQFAVLKKVVLLNAERKTLTASSDAGAGARLREISWTQRSLLVNAGFPESLARQIVVAGDESSPKESVCCKGYIVAGQACPGCPLNVELNTLNKERELSQSKNPLPKPSLTPEERANPSPRLRVIYGESRSRNF